MPDLRVERAVGSVIPHPDQNRLRFVEIGPATFVVDVAPVRVTQIAVANAAAGTGYQHSCVVGFVGIADGDGFSASTVESLGVVGLQDYRVFAAIGIGAVHLEPIARLYRVAVARYGRRCQAVFPGVLGHLVDRDMILCSDAFNSGDVVVHHGLVDLVTRDGVDAVEVARLGRMLGEQLISLLLAEGIPPPLDIFGLCVCRRDLNRFGVGLSVHRRKGLRVISVGAQGGQRVLQRGRVAVAHGLQLRQGRLGVVDCVVFTRGDDGVEFGSGLRREVGVFFVLDGEADYFVELLQLAF